MTNWIEIFSSGTHTANNGIQTTYTEQDLVNMADMYNNQTQHEAPIVIGHPQTDDPAYGWVDKLKVNGNKLLALFKDVQPEFIDLVKRGLYKKISISHYPSKLLKHVGFLGAVPPAVKGLAPIKYNSNEEAIIITIDFADKEYSQLNQPISNNQKGTIMDQFINELMQYIRATFGEDVAQKASTKMMELKEKYPIQQPVQPQQMQGGMSIQQPQMPQSPMQKSFSETPEYAEIKSAMDKAVERNSALQNQVYEMQFNEVFDNAVREGQLIPAQKDAYKAIFNSISETSSYSENGKTVSIDKITQFKKLIEPLQKNKALVTSNYSNGNTNERSVADDIKKYNGRR